MFQWSCKITVLQSIFSFFSILQLYRNWDERNSEAYIPKRSSCIHHISVDLIIIECSVRIWDRKKGPYLNKCTSFWYISLRIDGKMLSSCFSPSVLTHLLSTDNLIGINDNILLIPLSCYVNYWPFEMRVCAGLCTWYALRSVFSWHTSFVSHLTTCVMISMIVNATMMKLRVTRTSPKCPLKCNCTIYCNPPVDNWYQCLIFQLQLPLFIICRWQSQSFRVRTTITMITMGAIYFCREGKLFVRGANVLWWSILMSIFILQLEIPGFSLH